MRDLTNLGLDLVRVTEATALKAARWMGIGNIMEAHRSAMHASVEALSKLHIKGKIVIGEENRLGVHSPLDSGMEVGSGDGPEMDVIIDPIDGTSLLAFGQSGALSVVAVAPRGSMWNPGAGVYMNKIIVNREVAEFLVPQCLDAPAAWTLALVARAKKKRIQDLVVFVLNRPRHEALIEEIRSAGARVLLRPDGDISGTLMAALPDKVTQVDVAIGVGGIMEGIISACAAKALGGKVLGKLEPQNETERRELEARGIDLKQAFTSDDLVAGNQIYFAATAVVDGASLKGVHFGSSEAQTESLVLRAETHTRRIIRTVHAMDFSEDHGPSLNDLD
ncbi:MAG: class II fructose-bisphosphatase [Anaerolineae bacterium]|nr:class II fructose-bisphosphatase [Anaerolineae bacterium]